MMEKSVTLRAQFKCYFCNKTIKNETQMGHTTVCGSVLLPCPAKCGSYVRRMDLAKHRTECRGRSPKNNVRILSESELSETDQSTNNSPRDTRRLQLFFPHELSRMSPTRASLPLDRRISTPPPLIRSLSQCYDMQTYQQRQINALRAAHDGAKAFEKEVHTRLGRLESQIWSYDSFRKETNIHWMTAQQKFMQLDKIQMEVDHLKKTFGQDQTYIRTCLSNVSTDIAVVRDSLSDEVKALKKLSLDQCAKADAVLIETKSVDGVIGDIKAKMASLVFDVRALGHIASEATEKLEIQEKRFKEFQGAFVQLKADLQAVEQDAACQRNVATCSPPGQLLWKITDCDAKIEDAKTKGAVIKSPIFYTHNRGYKVRLHLNFNGLNKWKDRYALFCLCVLKGEYDMLLRWPTNIEGVVTLRDLENLDDPKNFEKKITARRRSGGEETEDPQESSTSYIFIPHTTMMKSKYMKDDTMFIDVKIDDKYLFS